MKLEFKRTYPTLGTLITEAKHDSNSLTSPTSKGNSEVAHNLLLLPTLWIEDAPIPKHMSYLRQLNIILGATLYLTESRSIERFLCPSIILAAAGIHTVQRLALAALDV